MVARRIIRHFFFHEYDLPPVYREGSDSYNRQQAVYIGGQFILPFYETGIDFYP